MASSTWYKEVAISSSVLFILKAHSLHIWLPCSAVFDISMQAGELSHSGLYPQFQCLACRSIWFISTIPMSCMQVDLVYIHNSNVLHAGRSDLYPQFQCLACRSIWFISTILMSCMQIDLVYILNSYVLHAGCNSILCLVSSWQKYFQYMTSTDN